MTGNPFTLPDLGGSDSGELVAWLVDAGETVDDDQPVAEVETEKSVVEVPAPNAGTVTELLVEEGSTVEVGAEILRIEADEAAATEPTDTESANAEAADADEGGADGEAEPEPTDQPSEEITVSDERVFAPPRVRRLARDLGVDIASVDGSGDSGRISEADVRAAAESEAEEADAAGPKPFTPSGKSAVSKASGAAETATEDRTDAAQSTAAVVHAAHHDTAVVDDLAALQEELEPHAEAQGVELPLLPLVIKAVVRTLADVPALNTTVDEGEAVASDDSHIGVAVATDDGLVVPVVENADEKTVLELAEEINELVDRADAGDVSSEATADGTFTVTTIGAIGDEYATLPVAESQTASLSLGAIEPRPVVDDGAVVARETLPLSLSVDPRAVDSTEAAAFLSQLVGFLESPNRLLLRSA